MTTYAYFPDIRKLAEYEVWCNAKAIDAAKLLSREQLFHRFPFGFSWSREPGAGTIHETLFHTVLVMQRWGGCVGPTIAPPPEREYDPEMSIDDLTKWNDEVSTEFLKSIDASHNAGVLHADRRLVQVFHLVTHGTHHRTQFISMLRMLGKDPPAV